jgi:hypothetical protein
MKTTELFILLFGASFFGWYIIRSASNALLAVGRSNKGLQKTKKLYSFKQKLFLDDVSEQGKKYPKQIKILVVTNKTYILVLLLTVFVSVLSLIVDELSTVAYYLVISKTLALDVPLIIFYFVMTEHDTVHGGVRWKH